MNDLQKRQREEQLVDWNKEAQELYREMGVAYNYTAFLEGYIAGRKKGDAEIEKLREWFHGIGMSNALELKEKEIAQLKSRLNGAAGVHDLEMKIASDIHQNALWEIQQLKEQLKREAEENQINAKLIAELAEVRIYNSANVFKGAMIRDNSKVHDLVKRARSIQAQREDL